MISADVLIADLRIQEQCGRSGFVSWHILGDRLIREQLLGV